MFIFWVNVGEFGELFLLLGGEFVDIGMGEIDVFVECFFFV